MSCPVRGAQDFRRAITGCRRRRCSRGVMVRRCRSNCHSRSLSSNPSLPVRHMPNLPRVLAGPIVRRITPRSASVWIALSESSNVTFSIWDHVLSVGTGSGVFVGETPQYTASRQTVRVGAKLHIAVVTIALPAAPAAPLFPGSLYSYNVSWGSGDLRSEELLVDFPGDPNTAPHL